MKPTNPLILSPLAKIGFPLKQEPSFSWLSWRRESYHQQSEPARRDQHGYTSQTPFLTGGQLLDTFKKPLALCNPFLITSQRHLAYYIILLHRFWESLLLFQPLLQKIVIDFINDITFFVANSTDDSLFLQPEQTRSSICGR